jgi:hypothetical protein
VFVPLVNLHLEHYWWLDEAATDEYKIFGRNFPVYGSLLRRYLWLQIIAGWLLSAIFLAGVTGGCEATKEPSRPVRGCFRERWQQSL